MIAREERRKWRRQIMLIFLKKKVFIKMKNRGGGEEDNKKKKIEFQNFLLATIFSLNLLCTCILIIVQIKTKPNLN
jgi:hypothetical protein